MKKSFITYIIIFLVFLLRVSQIYAQEIPTFIKYESLSTNSVRYTNEDGQPQAQYSTYVCGSGTIVRLESVTDVDDVVPSNGFDLQTSSGNNNSWTVPLEITFNPEVAGVVEVTIFQQRTVRGKGVFASCSAENWKPLLKYIIYRGVNPGGELTNNAYYKLGEDLVYENDAFPKTVTLFFQPSAEEQELIGSINYTVTLDGQQKKSISGLTDNSGTYTLNCTAETFGDYVFATQLRDNAGLNFEGGGPSKTVKVVPSCFNDTDPEPEIIGPGLVTYEEGYQVKPGETYTLRFPGITKLTNFYAVSQDGGNDILIDQNGGNFTFTVNSDLGSYRLEPAKNNSIGDYCLTIPPVKIFAGGRDITIEQPCPVNLPEDLTTEFGYEAFDDPENLVLEHFAATVKSNSQVVIKPGMTLTTGAELILEYAPPRLSENDPDLDMNYTQMTAYNDYGEEIAQSRNYYDTKGQHLQSQSKVLSKGVILASQNIRDAYDRPVVQTMAAPIITSNSNNQLNEDGCAIVFPTYFEYQEGFASGYNADDFDLVKRDAPNSMDQTQAGTLGWYYSNNNGSSNNSSINEPLTASTGYPYSRTLYTEDGSGEIIGQTKPGDAYTAGSEHVPTQLKKEVANTDPLLVEYLEIRKNELGFEGQSGDEPKFYKIETRDAEGRLAAQYQNYDGQQLIGAYYGISSVPELLSHTYYNNKGQVVCNITPNGLKQYQSGVPFENIDKTTYEYNWKGFTTAVTEKDGGRSEFKYAKDGRIRFSQNAQQKIEGKLSYTHYDKQLRPVESGEFEAEDGQYAFDGEGLISLLDEYGNAGYFPENSGIKKYINKSYYDKPMSDYPSSEPQSFVMGSVSASEYYVADSESPLHKTFYSYDERGRLLQMVQDIKSLGVKTITYQYGPSGNVKEVAYQAGNQDEYYHYYEYDEDSRLESVYSGTVAPSYNGQLEITNKEDLIHQASYDYYLHGPLKRAFLVQADQGMDYLYTVDGKLKAINSGNPDIDPGGDGQDVFGMVLNYHPEDYSSAQIATTGISQSNFPDEAQFTGNIQAQEWHSPVDGSQKKAYSYSYDQRQQLKTANFGTTPAGTFMDEGKYDVTITGYDANGNIKGLSRTDENGNALHSLTYDYAPESNRLLRVMQGDTTMVEYEYNAIGQMISQTSGADKLVVDYEVVGKVETVYASEAKSDTIMHIQYDNKGFRLSKTAYDSTYQAQFKTWYVRDASGTVMNIYVEAIQSEEEPFVYETPVYGASRLGAYRPYLEKEGGSYFYEVKDHLGNVRVVIGGRDSVNYLATMEDERVAEEIQYFSGINSLPLGSYLNHTSDSIVPGANRSVRINNVLDGAAAQPIGGGISLRVFPGDTVHAKIQAKYLAGTGSQTNVIPLLAGYLAAAFGLPSGGEGISNIFDVTDQASFAGLAAWDDMDENQPKQYLNYLLYDDDFNLIDFGFDQVSEQARIPTDTSAMASHLFEELSVEITTTKPGFVYIYFSNEDERNVTAYFDDMDVNHIYGNIAVATDNYPFGLAMESRKLERKYWRHGYQGAYAEKDEETNWNAFQLRMYDPVIGRWLSTDPYGQYPSPYLGMGNDPVNGIDPDGGWKWKATAWFKSLLIPNSEVIYDGKEWGVFYTSTSTGKTVSHLIVDGGPGWDTNLEMGIVNKVDFTYKVGANFTNDIGVSGFSVDAGSVEVMKVEYDLNEFINGNRRANTNSPRYITYGGRFESTSGDIKIKLQNNADGSFNNFEFGIGAPGLEAKIKFDHLGFHSFRLGAQEDVGLSAGHSINASIFSGFELKRD